MQFHKPTAGLRGEHYLVKFVGYALTAYYPDALGVAPEGLESLVVDEKLELCGEAHAPHHAQRVVAEGDVGVERRAYYAVLKVENAVERIDEFAEPLLFGHTAIALMVKSRRFWSSSSVPSSTIGLRESWV